MGRPAPSVEAKVVDLESPKEVEAGEAGELLLRGDNITPGYWERSELNEDSFTDGWLHTDDVVRRDQEGYYYYVDRVDDMILSGGEKVSPSSVESILQTMPGVDAVAVFDTPHDRLGETVTAAVIPSDQSLTGEDIKNYCAESDELADYKQPRRVSLVDRFPRTGSQKIDKRALSEQITGGSEMEQ
jgi:acyl-CoA synthetase (AMP-forming)/AMP-acid ligase II